VQITTPLAKARDSIRAGDFKTALIENEKAFRQTLPVSRVRALFQRCVIYSHPENPDRDYAAARTCFGQVIDEYPGSDLAVASESIVLLTGRMLAGREKNRQLLEKLAGTERMLVEHQLRIRRCDAQLRARQDDILDLSSAKDLMVARLKEEAESTAQCHEELEGRQQNVEDLYRQIDELKGQIEDFKKIDLNLEKKRQGLTQK